MKIGMRLLSSSNHQVKGIEKVIKTEDEYSVVEKNNSTSEPSDTLNKTPIDNS
ncbi:MAG: hypothetical protein WDN27_05125 [Candidatus Saccharibacteria bacterium]